LKQGNGHEKVEKEERAKGL